MSINANNAALNEILETINNLPSADGLSSGTVYTNIVYNDDNTVTLTDKDGVDHIMVCEYTDGILNGLTYDGRSVELTYEEDTLVNIGAIEVDMANAPIESGGGEDNPLKYMTFAYGNFRGVTFPADYHLIFRIAGNATQIDFNYWFTYTNVKK
jgi:hypothetical protein